MLRYEGCSLHIMKTSETLHNLLHQYATIYRQNKKENTEMNNLKQHQDVVVSPQYAIGQLSSRPLKKQ